MKGNGESATNNYQISTADAHMSARNIDAPNTLFARKHSQKKYGDEKKIKTAERILRANCPLSAADIFFAPSSDFMADISREKGKWVGNVSRVGIAASASVRDTVLIMIMRGVRGRLWRGRETA